MICGEPFLGERQPHLRLQRVAAEENAAGDAVVGGMVVEPLLVHGVAEFGRIGGHVTEDGAVTVSLLHVFVVLGQGERLREVGPDVELLVFLCVLQLQKKANPKPEPLNPKPAIRNPKPEIRNPKPLPPET